MKKTYYATTLIFILQGLFSSCSSNPNTEKELPLAEESVQEIDSSAFEKKSRYEELLKKFKPISFDTLKVFYEYNDKHFLGKELSLKEAAVFKPGITEASWGKLSGFYACNQFQIDVSTLGLIVRTPSEYGSSSIKLVLFDKKKDQLKKEYFELANDIMDGGEYYHTISWLIKTKVPEIRAFVYDYSYYDHKIAGDSEDTTIEESRSYFLIDCMSPKFDTISKNENQLKKRFRKLLKTEE
ncbi:hypothetical protein [Fluviicola taffensis]|uniref:Lipoprotein n=1 Tax=Fluviicola taffensis (strain DSM 16823 / NCIMB 13979 / RW262) TaxID=755732 RepID=F2IER8_FLUTR|nr:hypothetical protein [Fluviicola taffensis]AEA45635.1 hypothetical protein Fluta_3666 [Fluviicola taffensis DSM 16823]